MWELAGGAIVGIWLGSVWQLDASTTGVLAAVTAALLYLVSCAGWPWRRCWRCKGASMRDDGRGNLRVRQCRVCGGAGRLRRVGAVVLGRSS